MNLLGLLRQRYGAGEARALYEYVMRRRFGLSRTDVILGKDTTLSANDKAELQIILERVAKGEPVQYVLGSEEFCGRVFGVAPGVLVPRPETEVLVGLVREGVACGCSVLDVGTGSGCIAVTLALEGYRVTALDVSDEALGVAARNAAALGAEVELVRHDILLPCVREAEGGAGAGCLPWGGAGRRFDAVVSNPPYVCRSEAAVMEENVLLYEPHLALFVPDDDPLLFYRAIAGFGLRHLAPGGRVFFEANVRFCAQVGELLRSRGYEDVRVRLDQFGRERFVTGRLGRGCGGG